MTAPLQTRALAADSETLPRRLEDSWDEPLASITALLADHDELQGAWFSASGRRDAEFLISGTRFTMRFADGDIYMGVFELNPVVVPKLMAMHIEEGPARYKGKMALCLYEMDSRTLRWCAASPGQEQRLTTFPAEDDPQYLCLVFRRQPA